MKFLRTKKYSILSNVLKYSFVFILGFILVTSVAFADPSTGSGSPTTGSGGPTTGTGSSTNINVTIDNPLGTNGPQNIMDFIKLIVKYVLYIGIPIIALAIIYTGFLFVSASGNSEKLTKAKNALLYTLIGGALLLGAFVIANAISSTVDEIKKGV
jgi:hypothetical protein